MENKLLSMSEYSVFSVYYYNHNDYYSLNSPAYLEYLDLSSTGVESVQLPPLDDGLSEQIDILDGLPFGDGHPVAVWVRLFCIYLPTFL